MGTSSKKHKEQQEKTDKKVEEKDELEKKQEELESMGEKMLLKRTLKIRKNSYKN